MAWYDKYKKETILIHQEAEHNKFWSAQMDEKTFKVVIRWGRLGTKGQSQEKEFSAEYGAGQFIESKMSEKRRKGYRPIEKKKFDELSIQSAIVGSSNKCRNFRWVEITDEANLKFQSISEDRLADPACNPGVFVEVETKKEYAGRTMFALLFTFEQVFDVTDGRNITLVTKASPIYDLTGKVEEALGRTLSA